jgi:peptidoglycan/xylan/chitin deacetylase (PgdA/CDA1 family)
LSSKTQQCIEDACAKLDSNHPGLIFFRDDDVAVPGKPFAQLMGLFSELHVPLNLAVVPAWLTRVRWQAFMPPRRTSADLWCWHQHGWRHKNHEITGKNQEFGPSRSAAALEHDIVRGQRRLENLMGENFFPVFTPPWNRCDERTLRLLRENGYHAVSRSQNPNNSNLEALPDFYVNLDLHTRTDRTSQSGWANFLEELQRRISSGMCGIMIHHNRMNAAAFDYLEILLKMIVARQELRVVHFRELANIQKGSRFNRQI